MADRRLAKLYMLNLALLATHEIDSAYWHEWEMFHLPGGVQGFLVLNLLLLLIFIVGVERIVRAAPGAFTHRSLTLKNDRTPF